MLEQVLSNKLHSTLVIKPVSSKKISHAQLSLMLSNSFESTHHPTLVEISDPKSKITSLLHDSGTGTDICASSDNSVIVQGMKEQHSLGLSRKIHSRTF